MTYQILLGDARARLRDLADGSAHCIVTSPPYWGLRDYGTGAWDGGDDASCDHLAPAPGPTGNKGNNGEICTPYRATCGKCGATRRDDQVGLEVSVGDYVDALVSVFAEARRALRDDGTVWLNLGDSYGGVGAGLKVKDLVGVPWRVAFALQAAGWYLRSDIIWSKPNPMPESVTDRPTKAHEYVFLLAKAPRYHYDAAAIRTPMSQAMIDQLDQPYDSLGLKDYASAGVQNPSSVKARIIAGQLARRKEQAKGWNPDRVDGGESNLAITGFGANARSVWSISPEPSALHHFAIMPKALARKCIRTGCPPGGTVLDPFAGVGTTLVVALEEGRNAIGVELNPRFHGIARARCADVAPLFAVEVPEPEPELAERVP